MRHSLLSIIAFFFLTQIFAQKWEYKSGTNAFDGDYKLCYVSGHGNSKPFTSPTLNIIVYNDETLDIYLSNLGDNEIIPIFSEFSIILSKEPQIIYKVARFISVNSPKNLYFFEFINTVTQEKLTNIQFIEKLKLSEKMDMRFEAVLDKYDMQFSLNGSAEAINFVASKYSNRIKNEESIADAKAKAEAERLAKEKHEVEEKKKKLDALIGGVSKSEGTATRSEGNDNKTGDKGQLDGDPYSPSYIGSGGSGNGGVGYGLKGRGRPTWQIFKQNCHEEGLVVVGVSVDRNGKVIEAEPGVRGSTTNAKCLYETAKKIALSHKWPADANAPSRQIGFVSVNFELSN